MYNYLLQAAGPNADPAKVRLYCDRTLEHYDWLTRQGHSDKIIQRVLFELDKAATLGVSKTLNDRNNQL